MSDEEFLPLTMNGEVVGKAKMDADGRMTVYPDDAHQHLFDPYGATMTNLSIYTVPTDEGDKLMDDVKIDLTTGLPELPEGRFWSVDQRTRSWNNESFVQVSIKEHVERVETILVNSFIFGWFPKYKEETVHTTELIQGVIVRRSHGGAKVNKPFENLNPYELTPAHILAAAKECLENLSQRELAEALLGEYPPKSLPLDD